MPAHLHRDDVFVVIAAFHEAASIEAVLADVREVYPNTVVVDDGSTDDTFTIARRASPHALRHPINRGQGAALQTGIEWALRCGARYIVTFDGDGQHRVGDIDSMVAPLARGDCEITLGSRFLGAAPGMPVVRRITLKMAILFTWIFSGVRLTDAHNGFRAFTRRSAEQIDLQMDRMAHASEIIDQVKATGLPFQEVPVSIDYTPHSLGKAQASGRAIRTAVDYLMGRILR